MFAPLPPEDELVADVRLDELKGLPAEVIETLEAARFRTLRDVLDLEREDVLKINGMTPERTEVLLAFLGELTEENPNAVDGESAEEAGEMTSGEPEVTEAPPAA